MSDHLREDVRLRHHRRRLSSEAADGVGSRSVDSARMERRGQDLDPIDHARAGAGEVGVGVHGEDAFRLGQFRTSEQTLALSSRTGQVVATRHEDDDLGFGTRDLVPVDADRRRST